MSKTKGFILQKNNNNNRPGCALSCLLHGYLAPKRKYSTQNIVLSRNSLLTLKLKTKLTNEMEMNGVYINLRIIQSHDGAKESKTAV